MSGDMFPGYYKKNEVKYISLVCTFISVSHDDKSHESDLEMTSKKCDVNQSDVDPTMCNGKI